MEKNLTVPYVSQWDPSANDSTNDCGPASACMTLNYYGETLTVDEVFEKTGAGKGIINLSQIKKAVTSFGYDCDAYANGTVEKIKEFIDKGIPVILVVHYGILSSRQDTQFTGPHIMLLVGYRDDGYFVNDPDFWGQYRSHGDHHFYKKAELENAWEQSAQDGNVRNTFMVIYPKKVQLADSDMIIEKNLFKDLVVKATAEDKVATVLGYTPENGYPIEARNDPAFGDILVEKIKNLQTTASLVAELQQRNQLGVSTYTTTPSTQSSGTVTYTIPSPKNDEEKNILLQDVSTVFGKLFNIFGRKN